VPAINRKYYEQRKKFTSKPDYYRGPNPSSSAFSNTISKAGSVSVIWCKGRKVPTQMGPLQSPDTKCSGIFC
jgi:hypothetical protein